MPGRYKDSAGDYDGTMGRIFRLPAWLTERLAFLGHLELIGTH